VNTRSLGLFSYGRNELRMTKHAERLVTAAWEEAGAHDIWTFQRHFYLPGGFERVITEFGVPAKSRVLPPADLAHADQCDVLSCCSLFLR
jgi:hypothetical protein